MFGINKEIRHKTLNKIKMAKKYLYENHITYLNHNIPLSDFARNAYINTDKYIAEVNNRVYSLHQYATSNNLVNIFGTITLPSEYHPKIKNKYKNPKFINDEDHTPKEGAKQLSKMFKALLDTRQYKAIPKQEKCYFRVYEPHKDGTPHLHFSMYVPKNNLESVTNAFNAYFENNYEGLQVKFESDIYNPVAYLMKYILKTFDDYRADKDNITDLTLWYIHHGISRFYSSRTLVSLDVYRVLNGKYSLLELTYMYRNREINVYVDPDTNKILSITNEYMNIYQKKDFTKSDGRITLNYKKDEKTEYTKIDYTGLDRYIPNESNSFNGNPIIPTKLNDYQLFKYAQNLEKNIFNINVDHYELVKNETIKRGFNFNKAQKPIKQDLEIEKETIIYDGKEIVLNVVQGLKEYEF